MYKKVLLPLDLTDKHQFAVQAAIDFAKNAGAGVTLLHVIELIPGLAREEDAAFYDRLERSAKAHLEKIGKQLSAQKIEHRQVVVFGHRLEETMREIVDQKHDLIVVTSPLFDPAKPATGWGSLSFKISMLSPAHVLIVK
jgi:nucleotide-binding universal stress UspA family protein